MEQLDNLSIKLCEILPLDITLFEKEGECQKPSDICIYCKKGKLDNFCHKKTYNMEYASDN